MAAVKSVNKYFKTEQQVVVTTIGLVQMTANRINRSTRQISIQTPLVTASSIIEIVQINKIVPMKQNSMVNKQLPCTYNLILDLYFDPCHISLGCLDLLHN